MLERIKNIGPKNVATFCENADEKLLEILRKNVVTFFKNVGRRKKY
jgi:hypothetical protein